MSHCPHFYKQHCSLVGAQCSETEISYLHLVTLWQGLTPNHLCLQ